MVRTFPLGRPFGIALGVHASWLAVYALVAFGVGAAMRGIGAPLPFALGALGALLLFVSVVAHEYGHAFAARRFGVRTRSITLFLFGGVATLEREPSTPAADAWIALAGPATSAVIGALAFAALWCAERTLAGPLGNAASALAAYTAVANGVLAVFNMIPAYPTDGGRVLRALVWNGTRSHARATGVAAQIGFGFAVLLALAGIGLAAALRNPAYAWYVFVAVFLGRQSLAQAREAAATLRADAAYRSVRADAAA